MYRLCGTPNMVMFLLFGFPLKPTPQEGYSQDTRVPSVAGNGFRWPPSTNWFSGGFQQKEKHQPPTERHHLAVAAKMAANGISIRRKSETKILSAASHAPDSFGFLFRTDKEAFSLSKALFFFLPAGIQKDLLKLACLSRACTLPASSQASAWSWISSSSAWRV